MAGVLNRKSAPGELNGTFLSTYDERRAGPGPFVTHAFRQEILPGDPGVVLHAATPEDAQHGHARFELIVDQSNLLPFDFFRTGDRLGRAVVKIQRGDGAAGTGFLVAPDVLLTNHHVLPDAKIAAESKAVANYEANPPADPAGASAIVTLDPASLFVTNEELDFTFCGVRGLDYLGVVPLNRDSLNVAAPEYVNIIQHPRGRPKEVAVQDNRVVKADNVVVHYSCDTEPGSSGSPVFNNQWRLVALHHASVPADDGEAPPGSLPRYLNEGIRLSAIALWLESPHADEVHPAEQVGRLRSIFGGVDPQIGYFGTLGRIAKGTTAAEVVVAGYDDGNDELDLGYWNLRALRPRFRHRLHEFGRVVAEMGIDLWCFAHAGDEEVKLLRDHLKERFDLSYRVLAADPSASRPLTILHRSDGSLTVDRLADVTAPGGSMARPCLRVETTNARGATARFVVVPVAGGGWPRGERPARPGPLPDVPDEVDPSSDRLILGDGLRAEDVTAAASTDAALRFAAGDHGAVLWRKRGDHGPESAFISTNLGAIRHPEGLFTVAHDRRWPSSLHTLRAGRPLILRIPLHARSGPTSSATVLPPSAPVDAVVERLLRDLLAPIVAKLVAEARH